MALKLVGGRGKKAPYTSSTVRVPDPALKKVEEVIDLYRNSLEPDSIFDWYDLEFEDVLVGLPIHTREDCIEKAHQILRSKQSARKSLEKYLRYFFQDESIKL